jgi:hypothetical protein
MNQHLIIGYNITTNSIGIFNLYIMETFVDVSVLKYGRRANISI